jgi:toxin ParE1/3/4
VGKYRLTQAADKDLSDISAYSYREFGEQQADRYFESLEESLARLGDNPLLGVDVSSVRRGYRRRIHRRHAIYYKTIPTGVLIVRILGPGMSAEPNLT